MPVMKISIALQAILIVIYILGFVYLSGYAIGQFLK